MISLVPVEKQSYSYFVAGSAILITALSLLCSGKRTQVPASCGETRNALIEREEHMFEETKRTHRLIYGDRQHATRTLE